jgi:hypothetical protein
VVGTRPAAAHDGADRLHAAVPQPGIPAQRDRTIWGGGQRAPTACCAAATGTTTPTTRAVPTATTTIRTTPTTTTVSGLFWPQLNPVAAVPPG